MNAAEVCMSCMKNMGGLEVCMHCGWSETDVPRNNGHIPPRAIIGGRYMIGLSLTQNSECITYNAWDMRSESRVLVQELFPSEILIRVPGDKHAEILSKEDAGVFNDKKAAFLGKAVALRKLFHTGITLNVIDVISQNNSAYIVFEYMDGVPLDAFIDSMDERSLEPMPTVRAIAKILAALEREQIICPDLSPNGLFVSKTGKLLLLDPGRCISNGKPFKQHGLPLNGAYAAPEQFVQRSTLGLKSMLYSCGAIAYYAITGREPQSAYERTTNDELVPPNMLNNAIPEAVSNAVFAAMALKANKRFKSSTELIGALESKNRRKPPSGAAKEKKALLSKRNSALLVACLLVLAGVAILLFVTVLKPVDRIDENNVKNVNITVMTK